MQYLKELRTNNGYSQKYMADNLKISKTYYCQLENCQRKLSYKMAIKISNIFGLKPDQVFYNELKQDL